MRLLPRCHGLRGCLSGTALVWLYHVRGDVLEGYFDSRLHGSSRLASAVSNDLFGHAAVSSLPCGEGARGPPCPAPRGCRWCTRHASMGRHTLCCLRCAGRDNSTRLWLICQAPLRGKYLLGNFCCKYKADGYSSPYCDRLPTPLCWIVRGVPHKGTVSCVP